MTLKRQKDLADQELFAPYCAIAQEAREVVQAHVAELVEHLEKIIESGISSREFKDWDTREEAQAVFNATIRFHHPAHACEWSHPDIDTDFANVWRLVKAGLVHDEDV